MSGCKISHALITCQNVVSEYTYFAQLFSLPEQRSQRAVVLSSVLVAALTAQMLKLFFFKTLLFPNLIIDLIRLWYDDT